MTETLQATWAVVLAGGAGTRFWPASTPQRPKQLLPLGGDRPLVEETWNRAVSLVGRERVRIVATQELLDSFRLLLPSLPETADMPEPVARGTAPALAWAAHHVARQGPEAVMVSMHADHVIHPLEGFRDTVRRAAEAAREDGRLYCIGARPDRPETGYGYVRLGPERRPGVYEADAFVEKPDQETAAAYLEAGGFFWNTGIFVWRASDFLEAMRRYTPEVSGALRFLDEDDVSGFFRAVEPVSVDVGVLERSDAVGVVEAAFEWDDVGVWNAVARIRTQDAGGNTVVGEARLLEARDNIVWSEEGRVTLFGVEGLVVVRAGDETLVAARDRAPELKEALARLEAEGTTEGEGAGRDA